MSVPRPSNPLDVPCPSCHSGIGAKCHTVAMRLDEIERPREPHAQRTARFNRAQTDWDRLQKWAAAAAAPAANTDAEAAD